LTDDEYEALRSRADRAKVSVPRYLIEAALSGSASAAAEQRQLRRDVERTQLVLAGLANNVNQMAKWANTNRVLPDSFESALGDIGRATAAVTEAAQRVKGVFGAGR
jgi:ABC-type transporter Mla subunit MlaD